MKPCTRLAKSNLAALLPAALLTIGLAARAASPALPWTGQPNADWKAMDLSQTAVLPGSPLDMSRFVESPAGKYGRVTLDSRGALVFQGQPERRVVFFGCSVDPEFPLGRDCPDKESIRRWTAAIRRQGYNTLPPAFSRQLPDDRQPRDLVFDPVALDRFDYLVGCLKENGIYLYFDAMTSSRRIPGRLPLGAARQGRGLQVPHLHRARRPRQLEDGRGATAASNPYTKTRLADDPVVAVVLFFNEQNLNFFGSLPESLAGPWRSWLRKKYGNDEAFRKAWTNAAGKSPLKPGVTLEQRPPLRSQQRLGDRRTGPRRRTVPLRPARRAARLVRQGHPRGRLPGPGDTVRLAPFAPRPGGPQPPAGDLHAQLPRPPSDFTSKGSRVSQESAVATAGRFFTDMAMTRYGDRPLLITEYGHVFWNRYRYEEGLLAGAYAALQDFDGLMVHHNPVVERAGHIIPFWAGNDPVARASQVVAGFAYLRRDVAPSPRRVEITLRRAEIFDAALLANDRPRPGQAGPLDRRGPGLSRRALAGRRESLEARPPLSVFRRV